MLNVRSYVPVPSVIRAARVLVLSTKAGAGSWMVYAKLAVPDGAYPGLQAIPLYVALVGVGRGPGLTGVAAALTSNVPVVQSGGVPVVVKRSVAPLVALTIVGTQPLAFHASMPGAGPCIVGVDACSV
jgi:hypothetical protein